MQVIITILIIAGIVIFFGPESCGGEDNKSNEAEAQIEDSGSRINTSDQSADADQPFSKLRQVLPELQPENEMILSAQASQARSSGICPSPADDVQIRAQEWQAQESKYFPMHYPPSEERDYLVIIQDGVADFGGLEDGASLVVARNILLDRALLEAKANIIGELWANYSADTYTDFPEAGMSPTEAIYKKGEDIREKKKDAREELEAINEELARVSEAVIEADEDAMAGVGVVDQLERFIGAASTKLDDSLKREDITAEEERLVRSLKARLQELESRKKTIENQVEELDAQVLPYAQAVVSGTRTEKNASQTLYGTRILKQFFCFNEENRSAALLVRLVWSSKLQREAESTLLREPVELEPTVPGVNWGQYVSNQLETSEPSLGRFVEPSGNLIWYAIRHKKTLPGNTTAQRQALRTLTEGQLIQSLFAQVATNVRAEEALINAQDGRKSFTTQQMVGRQQAVAKDISLSGVQGFTGVTENPNNGENMLFHVAWVDPMASQNARKIIQQIEATNFRFHKDQSYWKGLYAGMQAMGASTKGDPEANRKGFNEGASGVLSEANKGQSNDSGDETKLREKIGLEKSRRWESEASDDF